MGLLGAMAGLGKGLSMVAEDNLKTIQRNEETVASEDRQRRVAEWQAKMSEEYAIAREERAVQRKRGEEAELASATDKAETRSAEIGTDRRFQKFMEDGKQAGYFEGMSPEEIKGVFEQTYDDKRVNAQEGGDRYQDKTLAVKADDFVKASRESGNAGLLTQALNDRKTAIGQDNTNAANAFKEREAARKEERDAADRRETALRIAQTDQRIAASAARASSSSDKPEKIGEIDKMELQDLRTEWRNAQKLADEAMGEKAKTKAQARADALKTEYEARRNSLKPESSKPSTSKPAGGQSDRLSQFKVIR